MASTETRMSHTPGPWGIEVDAETRELNITSRHRPYVAIVLTEDVAWADTQCRTNAALIAAAPDLLTLARQYANDMRYPPAQDSRKRRLEAIEAAIAKATVEAA